MATLPAVLAAAMQCPGCKKMYKDPVTAPCGDTLCASCIVGKLHCPACGVTFSSTVPHVPSTAVAALVAAVAALAPAAPVAAPAAAPAAAPVAAPAAAASEPAAAAPPATAAASGGASGGSAAAAAPVSTGVTSMTAEEVEPRMGEMRGKDRKVMGELRDAAVAAFKVSYAGHMLPAAAVAAMMRHLARHPEWTDDACATYIASTLDDGDTPHYLTSTQTEAVARCRGRELEGRMVCGALVTRTIDPWKLTWDGMDACTLTCLNMRPGVFPIDDADIWAWLHSRAAVVLRAGGNCCACGKAWPGWRG